MSWKDDLRDTIWGLEAYRTHEYRPGLVRLDANESPFPLDEAEREVIAAELSRLPLHRYPEVSGRPLREAVAAHFGLEPDEILVGNGSDEMISVLLTAFAAGKRGRGKALFPVPTFGEYQAIARAHGMETVTVPLDDEWRLDEGRAREAILEARPAVAIFASPNNPTGNRLEPAALDRLARASGCVFAVDEAYADFAGTTQIPLVREIDGFCVLRSFSKIGLAGLRVGALVASRELVAQLDKVRLPFNLDAVALAAACAFLENPRRLADRIRRIKTARQELRAGLARIPDLIVYPSDANFILVRVPLDGPTVWKRMLERDVLVRVFPGDGPLRDCLRITAGTPEENERCVAALAAAIA